MDRCAARDGGYVDTSNRSHVLSSHIIRHTVCNRIKHVVRHEFKKFYLRVLYKIIMCYKPIYVYMLQSIVGTRHSR